MTLAVFDFDGTIIRKDSLVGIIRQKAGLWGLVRALTATLPYIVGWKLGFYSNSEAKQRLFSRVFGGMPADRFKSVCKAYFDVSWPDLIRPGAAEEIQKHINDGHKVAIVTASGDCWVKPFATALGIATVIGTGIEVGADGCLTGKFSTPNCHGSEKVRRIIDKFGSLDSLHIIAYGDSGGDKEMLAIADEAHYKPFR